MRHFLFVLVGWALSVAAEPARPAPSALDGLSEAAQASDDRKQATLDGGSTIGLIPLSEASAGRTLGQYVNGFFREDDVKSSTLPAKAAQLAAILPQLKAAGATHLVALSHEGADEVEYVRFVALGDFTDASVAGLVKAGWGRRDADGSFEVLSYKDGVEAKSGAALPPLPVARLSQMAHQLASQSDCAVDIIPLASRDAVRSLEDALKEAFAEEGESAAKAELPARARQFSSQLPDLKALGATHVVVTAFQNQRGADVVLVVAKGAFDADKQAAAKARLGGRLISEGTWLLARWVDGEERGGAEAPAAAKAEPAPVRRPGKFR